MSALNEPAIPVEGNAGASEAPASTVPPATRRVLDALDRSAVPYELRVAPDSARTTQEIADAFDCDIHFIVFGTILRGKATKKPVLLMVSGATAVNERHLGAMVGENLARPEPDFVQRLTGYPADWVPPMPHLNRIPIMMDTSLMRFARIWCAAGAPGHMVSVPTLVIARAISARIVRFDMI